MATPPTCPDSLQAKIDAASSGGTVIAYPCVYREQVTIDKPLTLKGQSGSEIRGSDIWSRWTYSGGYWQSDDTLPHFPQPPEVECMPDTSRCLWPEQVFFDDEPLQQVAPDQEPQSGQFAVDAERRVVLADDPEGHQVEVTVRRHWVLGKASNVTLEGFTMKHAANEGRSGAIMNRMSRLDPGHSNWVVQDNMVSDAHGAVVNLRGGTGNKLLDNDISRGGQLGVRSGSAGYLVRGNKIHDNNTEDFYWGWEAGGFKAASTSAMVVDGNEVYNNKGNGVWCDVGCKDITYSNNRIHHNARRGIHYEISSGGRIFGNVAWENGWATPNRANGAGIGVSNSTDTEIYSNTLAWNADGIGITGLDRNGTDHDLVLNIHVHHNTILMQDLPGEDLTNHFALGWISGWSPQMFDPDSNNRGEGNVYWYPDPEGDLVRFEWEKTGYPELEDFEATPGEEGGRYLTQAEKDAVVADKSLPTNSEPR